MCLRFATILFTFIALVTTEPCVTPNGEDAECIYLNACPVLLNALATKESAAVEFVRKSTCGFTGTNPKVCCGSATSFRAAFDEDVSALSDRRYCGMQHSDDYYRTENGIAINEFPWSAMLCYEDGSKTKVMCSGSLINNRYVLTAAHCVNHTFGEELTLAKVRLGEYNVKNKTDCTGSSNYYECSEPPMDFSIEKIIIHSGFNKRDFDNDIALLRLSRTVTYSDYIRPICLPTPGTIFAKTGEILTTSGWGRKDADSETTDMKKKILTELIPHEECRVAINKTFMHIRNNVHVLTQNQVCTCDLESNTDFSCIGDGGGPVMFRVKNQWHQEGIISYGIGCHAGDPEIHTRVASYLHWMKQHILP